MVETKSIRVMLLFVIIQFLIVILFVLLVRGSRQIDMNDTKQIDITVDDIYIIRVAGEDQLVVVADSTEYLFEGRATFEDHSVHALYNSISKGDSLSLIYYESDRILFKSVSLNWLGADYCRSPDTNIDSVSAFSATFGLPFTKGKNAYAGWDNYVQIASGRLG